MAMSVNGQPVQERWTEFGVEDLEGTVEVYDDIDEALDIILFRRALYGKDKEGTIVVREVIAFDWKRPDHTPERLAK